jgi:hypothetical protein
MPKQKIVKASPGVPITVTVVSQSPHVVAYRFWSRQPGQDWVLVREGDTRDDVPDSFNTEALPKDSELLYWLGIGGNPNTPYRALVTLDQNAKRLEGGTCSEDGNTDGNGYGSAPLHILLQAVA